MTRAVRPFLLLLLSSLATVPACGSANGDACKTGFESCVCYGNATCQSGLTCASNRCVKLGGTGGAQGGVGGGGGAIAGTGGTVGGIGGSTDGTGGTLGGVGGMVGGTGGAVVGGTGGTLSGTGGTIVVGGTGGSAGGPGGMGGGIRGTGGGASGGAGGFLLLPSVTGNVNNSGAGIVGNWYSFADAYRTTTALGKCVTDGAPACSMFNASSPAQADAFGPSDMPITVGKMCASGTVAQVVADTASAGALDYGGIWGAYIALSFNGVGAADGSATPSPYNAPAHGITGIAFDIDNVPPANGAPSLRVELTTSVIPGTTDKQPAYWNGAIQNNSPVSPGTNSFYWANVSRPMSEANYPAFDPTKILAIQFHVIANPSSPINFNFCISNLIALTTPAP